jgi:hypothetical protein
LNPDVRRLHLARNDAIFAARFAMPCERVMASGSLAKRPAGDARRKSEDRNFEVPTGPGI